MNKMMVIVFDDESGAFDGLTALKDLDRDGSITLYAQMVIKKNDKGEVTVKDEEDSGPIGTAIGMATGSLVGLLGGPVGLLLGAYGGAMGGMIFDMQNAGIDGDFVDSVSDALTVNKVAIVADIDEDWIVPIDSTMDDLGGLVLRKLKYRPEDGQFDAEIEVTVENLKSLNEGLEDASAEDKPVVIKHIESEKQVLAGISDKIKKNQEKAKNEFDEKKTKINSQLKDAGDWNTKRLTKKLERIEADYSQTSKRQDALQAKIDSGLATSI